LSEKKRMHDAQGENRLHVKTHEKPWFDKLLQAVRLSNRMALLHGERITRRTVSK
jgi:hypothetical protein